MNTNTIEKTNVETAITNIRFGTLHMKYKMPVVELVSDERVVGYLSPFRGYKFQVSGSLDGQMDMGSTEVVGLGNILTIKRGESSPLTRSNVDSDGIQYECLKGLAALALMEFCERHGYHLSKGSFRKITEDAEGYSTWGDDLDMFTIEVVRYLRNFNW